MKNKYLLIGLILLICQSCGITDLGDNFAVVEADINDITIQYCFTGDCSRSGWEVVPPKVIEYNVNSNWIIAKTKSIEEGDTLYWIVDKKISQKENNSVYELLKKNIRGPLDSATFFNQIKVESIDLELKKY